MSVEAAQLNGKVMVDATQAKRELQTVRQSFLDVGTIANSALGGMVTQALTAGMNAIAQFAQQTIVSGMGYEQSMNILGAVTRATGSEMAALGAKAIELGNDMTLPSVSAADAADSMNVFAKAGFDVDQILLAVKGSLQLATATGLGFADAARVQASALKMFHLDGSQASHVADLLASAANSGLASISDLGSSLSYAGIAAYQSGVSIEQTVAALNLLGNSGIAGSMAGTQFRQMLMSLQAPVGDAKDTLDALGITVFDTSGKMRPMRDIVNQFTEALDLNAQKTIMVGGATKKQAEEAVKATSAIASLSKTVELQNRQLGIAQQELAGIEKKYGSSSLEAQKKRLAIDTLKNSIGANNAKMSESGARLDAFAKATGTSREAVVKMTQAQRVQALESIFGIRAMQAAEILLTNGTEEWDAMTDAISRNGSANELASARMKGFNGVVSGFQNAMETLMLEVFAKIAPLLIEVGTAALKVFQDIAPQFRDWIGKAVADVAWFIQNIDKFKGVIVAVGAVLIGGALISFFAGLIAAINPVTVAIAALVGVAALIGAAFDANFAGLKDIVEGVMGPLKKALDAGDIGKALDLIGAAFGKFATNVWTIVRPEIEKLGRALWAWIQEVAPKIPPALRQIGDAIWAWITGEAVPFLAAGAQQLAAALGDWITTTALPAIGQGLLDVATAIGLWITNTALPAISTGAQQLAAALWMWITDTALPAIGTALAGVWTSIQTWISGTAASAGTSLGVLAEKFWRWLVVDAIPDLIVGLNGMGDTIYLAIGDMAEKAGPALGTMARQFITWIIETVPKVSTELWKIEDAIGRAIVEWIGTAITNLPRLQREFWQWIIDAVPRIVVELGNTISAIQSTMAGWATELNSRLRDIGIGIINGLTAGIENRKAALEASITGVFNGVTGFFKSLFGIASPSTVFEGFGGNIIQGLADGITGAINAVTGAISGVFTAVTNLVSTIITTAMNFTNLGRRLAEDLTAGFNEKRPILEGAVSSSMGAIERIWDGGVTNLKTTTSTGVQGISSQWGQGIGGMVSATVASLSGMTGSFQTTMGQIAGYAQDSILAVDGLAQEIASLPTNTTVYLAANVTRTAFDTFVNDLDDVPDAISDIYGIVHRETFDNFRTDVANLSGKTIAVTVNVYRQPLDDVIWRLNNMPNANVQIVTNHYDHYWTYYHDPVYLDSDGNPRGPQAKSLSVEITKVNAIQLEQASAGKGEGDLTINTLNITVTGGNGNLTNDSQMRDLAVRVAEEIRDRVRR